MRLTRTAVVTELELRGQPFEQTAECIELNDGWCLRAGSGIAARNHTWFLWRARGGAGAGERSTSAKNLTELRRLLDGCKVLKGVVGRPRLATSTALISRCEKYRYALTRTWDVGNRLLWIMLNPSTADATVDDPTIRRCIGFSRAHGFASMEVVNLFALRATRPAELARAVDPVGPDNDRAILRAVERAKRIVVAWGTCGGLRDRDVEVLRLLSGWPLVALGVTATGQPRHPLYLDGNARLVEYARDDARRDHA